MIGAAAALFPVSTDGHRIVYGRLGRAEVWSEYVSAAEGPLPFLEVGPGMVRFGRRDQARFERAEERRRSSSVKAGAIRDARTIELEGRPMALRTDVGAGSGMLADDRRVEAWSRKSRANLIRRIASLDLEPLVTGETPPAMITLTLPGPWEAVCPDAATGARLLDTWRAVYERRWKTKLRCIWKREFQRRGAPHWHLWLVIPTTDRKAFREWLSASWVSVCRTRELAGEEHERRHLAAGTGVDFAEGLRARDPKRLALYFLKETLGGEGKAYQNAPPESWRGQSVGRYWGVRGIENALERVTLDPAWGHRLWRAMRKWQEASLGAREVRVPRGVSAAGVVRYRKVRRRARVRAGAGWVAVNDGAVFASALSRLADVLAADHAEVARQAEEDAERRYLEGHSAASAGLPSDHVGAGQDLHGGLSVQQRRDLAVLERARPRG